MEIFEEVKYLMIRRKDSLGYVDFMRGKYNLTSKDYLLNIINEMTITEKHSLLTSNANIKGNNLLVMIRFKCLHFYFSILIFHFLVN